MREIVLVAGLVIAAATTAHGQDMGIGTRVRVWSTNALLRDMTVTIDSVTGGVLYSSKPPLRLPVTDINRIEYPTPRSRHEGIRHGAKIGAFTGLAIGVVVGITTKRSTQNGAVIVPIAAPAGALVGAILGAGVGAIIPGKHWRCVPGAPCNRT